MFRKDSLNTYYPRILFMFVTSIVVGFFALLSWNLYTTYDLSTKFSGSHANQTMVMDKLELISSTNKETQKQVSDLQNDSKINYASLSEKVDSLKDEIRVLQVSANKRSSEITGLRIADEQIKSDVNQSGYRLEVLKEKLSKLEQVLRDRDPS